MSMVDVIARQAEVVRLLAEMIRFPSLSHEEGPIADFVETYVTGKGMPVSRHRNNVFFSLGDGPNRLLLNSHLDVVPASDGHPYDPFLPTLSRGKLYGRGSVDAKASGAAMITTLLDLAHEGWSPVGGQVIVALTACEEEGRGYNGLEDIRPMLPPLHAAVVGEPTSLRPCTAQKGLLILKARASGRTAHAARSHLGDNAIERAARDITRLVSHEFSRVHSLLGPTRATVTRIEGGLASNIVPDHCEFTIDVRSTPEYTHGEVVTELRGMLESEIEVHSDRLVPVSTDHDEPIVHACVAASKEDPIGSPTMSDWLFVRDLPTVKLGPGASELSHTADEHVDIDELVTSVDVYKKVIRNYFAASNDHETPVGMDRSDHVSQGTNELGGGEARGV